VNEQVKRLAGLVITRNGPVWRHLARRWWHVTGALSTRTRSAYRRMTRDSIFWRAEELEMCSLRAPALIAKSIELFKPSTVLDLGCGTGQSLDMFLTHGIDVIGIEGSRMAISQSRHPERIHLFNLNHELNLNRRFDLIWSFEFVEHIHPRFVDALMRTFSNHSDCVVLSAAKPGQGGEGHFNEQPECYWIERFAEHGFAYDIAGTNALRQVNEQFSDNILAFSRADVDVKRQAMTRTNN
jgi:SAM-dependent methyltransferase